MGFTDYVMTSEEKMKIRILEVLTDFGDAKTGAEREELAEKIMLVIPEPKPANVIETSEGATLVVPPPAPTEGE